MWQNRYNYIRQDVHGRWINTEFLPESFTQYPNNEGYKNANSEMLYYQFGVQYNDLRINYKGERYFAIVDDDNGAYIANSDYDRISDVYPTANDLIRGFRFSDGMSLIELADDSKSIFIQYK